MSGSSELKLPQNLLAGKNTTELQKLSNDNAKLVEFFSSLTFQEVDNAKQKKEDLVAENKQLAQNACNSKPRFESLKAALKDKSLEAAALKVDYEKRFAELKALSTNDPASILKALQEAKKTEEQHSENLADSFVSGKQNNSVEEFMQQYLASRKLYWLRKVKADKLDEQIKAMPLKVVPRPSRTPSLASAPQESLPAANPQAQQERQPPYPPTASLPPSFPPQPNNALPTQSLQYRPPQPRPYAGPGPGYMPPNQPRPYGPPPPMPQGGYQQPVPMRPYQPPPPPGSFVPSPYQSIGTRPPPRPQSQPFPYPVYQPPYR